MAKYKVKHTSILHNGKLYKEGSEIELTEAQAKRLEDFVTLIPNQTPAKPKNENQTKTQTAKTSNNKPESKSETKTPQKTETGDTSKDGSKDEKGSEQDGGVDNDK